MRAVRKGRGDSGDFERCAGRRTLGVEHLA